MAKKQTTPNAKTASADDSVTLRDPAFAAFLAWLVPGLGHIYQGRSAKGVLFSVCVLTTFFYGLFLGGGRVVYASWGPETRWAYLCQVGVGLPAMPALVQWQRLRTNKQPFLGESRFMVPPGMDPNAPGDSLHFVHRKLHRYFDLGTVYTMIAGLLNMLVIYDAFAGPAFGARRKAEDDTGGPETVDPAPDVPRARRS